MKKNIIALVALTSISAFADIITVTNPTIDSYAVKPTNSLELEICQRNHKTSVVSSTSRYLTYNQLQERNMVGRQFHLSLDRVTKFDKKEGKHIVNSIYLTSQKQRDRLKIKVLTSVECE